MRRLKEGQHVTYEVARLRAWDAMDTYQPVVASAVGCAIWPNANMTGQGLGGAASRILKRMQAEGLAYWTTRTHEHGESKNWYKTWGWVRSGARPGGAKPEPAEDKECADCGEQVTTGDVCTYCGAPLHPDAPPGELGRCTSNHEFECDQNPDNQDEEDL